MTASRLGVSLTTMSSRIFPEQQKRRGRADATTKDLSDVDTTDNDTVGNDTIG